MYKICKIEESAARQKQLEKGLMKLMQKTRFEDITVSSLCAYVKVPRNSFYRYFSNKEDVLLALIDHTLMEANDHTLAKWSGCPHLDLAVMENFFVYWKKNHNFLEAITKNGRSWLIVERSIHLQEPKQPHPEESIDAQGFAQEQTRYILTYGMMSILLRWHSCGYPAEPKEMAKVAFNMLSSSNIAMKDLLL